MSHENEIDQICQAIMEMVAEDIVSLAEVRQIFDELSCGRKNSALLLPTVLFRVLDAGVEIGHATNKSGNYVEFIGWRGSPEVKVKRTIELISSDILDTEFGVWLALRSNVDRWETT
jgi:hypothetical protein